VSRPTRSGLNSVGNCTLMRFASQNRRMDATILQIIP